MKIVKISYNIPNWTLENLHLGNVNLLVGKNAVGKSRVFQTIDLMAKIISQIRQLDYYLKNNLSVNWCLAFLTNTKDSILYEFSIKNKSIYEKITYNDEIVLKRENENATIQNFLHNKTIDEVYPPLHKLVLHTNRDIRKYPFLESIALWAENLYGFRFANISAEHTHNKEVALLDYVEDIPLLFGQLNAQQRENIVQNMHLLGYEIEAVGEMFLASDLQILTVKEAGIEALAHTSLSQGMLRALYMLIFLEYLVSQRKPYTVIIDDLCEGLDYDRATCLGKFVFDICEKNDIQLIATSNDSFLMEVIDIKYWNVLQRKKNKVTGISQAQYPALFKAFRFTGLSNFDFFSSDFIAQKI